MEEEVYLYNGKTFTADVLREKYGEDYAIKIKEIGGEKAYAYNGKYFGESTLKEKYGDDYYKIAQEKGIIPQDATREEVKKNESPTQEPAQVVSESGTASVQESGTESTSEETIEPPIAGRPRKTFEDFEDEDALKNKEKVLAISNKREGARENEDGSVSTVKMAWAESDGKYFVYPTLFEDNGEWIELDDSDNFAAFKKAKESGEAIEVKSRKEAEELSGGSWKPPVAESTEDKKKQEQDNLTALFDDARNQDLTNKEKEYLVQQEAYEQFKYTGEVSEATKNHAEKLGVKLSPNRAEESGADLMKSDRIVTIFQEDYEADPAFAGLDGQQKLQKARDYDGSYDILYDPSDISKEPIILPKEKVAEVRNQILSSLTDREEFKGKSMDDLTEDQLRVIEYEYNKRFLSEDNLAKFAKENNQNLDLSRGRHAANAVASSFLDMVASAAEGNEIINTHVNGKNLQADAKILEEKARLGAITKKEYETKRKVIQARIDKRSKRFEEGKARFLGVIPQSEHQNPIQDLKLRSFDEVLESEEEEGRFKVSSLIRDKNNLDRNPDYAGDFFTDMLPSGAGSMAAFMVAGAMNPLAAIPVGALANGSHLYNEALAAGKTSDEAMLPFVLGLGIGATEGVTIARFFKRVNKLNKGDLGNKIKAAKWQAVEEGGQEFLQDALNNLTAQQLYDETRQIVTEETFKSAAVGGILGLLSVAATQKVTNAQTTDELLLANKALKEIDRAVKKTDRLAKRGKKIEDAIVKREQALADIQEQDGSTGVPKAKKRKGLIGKIVGLYDNVEDFTNDGTDTQAEVELEGGDKFNFENELEFIIQQSLNRLGIKDKRGMSEAEVLQEEINSLKGALDVINSKTQRQTAKKQKAEAAFEKYNEEASQEETTPEVTEGKKEVFKPKGYYEALDEDGYPVIENVDQETGDMVFRRSSTPEVAASKSKGGAIAGLLSMFRSFGGDKKGKIGIYKITDNPDIEVSGVDEVIDFKYINEVRYRREVSGELVDELSLTDEQVEVIEDLYKSLSGETTSEEYGAILDKYGAKNRVEFESMMQDKIANLISGTEDGVYYRAVPITQKATEGKKKVAQQTKQATDNETDPTTEPRRKEATTTKEEQLAESARPSEAGVEEEVSEVATAKVEAVTKNISEGKEVSDDELTGAIQEGYEALEAVEKDKNMSESDKEAITELIEDEIIKLEEHESTTTNETREVTEKRTVRVFKKDARKAKAERPEIAGTKAIFSDNKGNGGRGVIAEKQMPDGKTYYTIETNDGSEVVVAEKGSVGENAEINFDGKGNPVSITISQAGGAQTTIKSPELADALIEEAKGREYSEDVFEEVEVETKSSKQVRVPKKETKKDDTNVPSNKKDTKSDKKPVQKKEKATLKKPKHENSKGDVKVKKPTSREQRKAAVKAKMENHREDMAKLVAEFKSKGFNMPSFVNPEPAVIAAKIVAKYIEIGVTKLSDILLDVKENFGKEYAKMEPAIKAAYKEYRRSKKWTDIAVRAAKEKSRAKFNQATLEFKSRLDEAKKKGKDFRERRDAVIDMANQFSDALIKAGIKRVPTRAIKAVVKTIKDTKTDASLQTQMQNLLDVFDSIAVTDAEVKTAIASSKAAKSVKRKSARSGFGAYSGVINTMARLPRSRMDSTLRARYDKLVIALGAGVSDISVAAKEASDIIDAFTQAVAPTPVKKVASKTTTQEELSAAKSASVSPVATAEFSDSEQQAIDVIDSLTDEEIDGLSREKVRSIPKIIREINSGFVPPIAQKLKETILANREEAKLNPKIEKAFSASNIKKKLLNPIRKAKGGLKAALTFNIDSVLGLKGDTISKFLSRFEEAFEEKKIATQKIRSGLGKKLDKVSRVSRKARRIADTKVMMYAIQKQFEDNEGSGVVHSLAEFIESSLGNAERKAKYKDAVGEKSMAVVEELYNKYKDANGDVDSDTILRDMSKAEQDIYTYMRETLDELLPMAEKISGLDRGELFNKIMSYFSYPVIMTNQGLTASQMLQKAQHGHMSTKAGVIQSRQKKASQIHFSAGASFLNAINDVLLDYHLGEPLRVEMKALDRLVENTKDNESAELVGDFVNTIKEQRGLALSAQNSSVSKTVSEIQAATYRYLLGKIPRFVTETAVNMTRVALKDILSGKMPLMETIKALNSNEQTDNIIENIGSSHKTRMLSGATLAGYGDAFVSIGEDYDLDFSDRNADKRVASFLSSAGWGSKKVSKITIEKADQLFSRGMFIGSLKQEFKRITGRDLDLQKVASKDEAYLSNNKEAIADARRFADDAVGGYFSTTNRAQKSVNQLKAAKEGGFFNRIKYFMLPFILSEGQKMQKAIVNDGVKGLIQTGVPVIAGMAAYQALSEFMMIAYTKILSAVFDKDDDKDENVFKVIAEDRALSRGLAGAMLEVSLLRHFNGVARIPMNLLIEIGNKHFGDDIGLRKKGSEYDPYNSVVFNKIDTEKGVTGAQMLQTIVPEASPSVLSIESLYKAYQLNARIDDSKKESTKETLREKQEYFLWKGFLTSLGAAGVLPRDVRDAYVYYRNRDLILHGAPPKKGKLIWIPEKKSNSGSKATGLGSGL